MKYIFSFFLLLSLHLSAQVPTGRTLKIGTVYWAIDDSTGVKSIYEVWNNQCPPNIYVHDTLYEIPGGYSSIRPTVPPIPQFIHDTTWQCPPLPALFSVITTQTLPTSLGNDHDPSGAGIEVGSKFRSTTAGVIRGIRFYKVAGNSGVHTGELYSSAGVRLASAVFSGETASGWQTVQFPTPVPVAANTSYVAAVFSAAGYYSGTTGLLVGGALTNAPLSILATGTDGVNGLYNYSNAAKFPTGSYNGTYYWVDLIWSAK